MKHRYHKVKFGGGRDADKMLLRKLAHNFLTMGKLETTKQKAKVAQSVVERLVTKAKTNTEADRKFILQRITDAAVLDILVGEVVPALKNVTSGYTRVINLGIRQTDGAAIARLEWAYPVVIGKKEEPVKAKKKIEEPQKTDKS